MSKKAILADILMPENADWFAVGVSENFKPVIFAFSNKRGYDGQKFGKPDRFIAEVGDTVVFESKWVNDKGQYVATAWALSDEKLTLQSLAPKAVAEIKPAAKPTPAAKVVKPLKLTVDDDRMVELRLVKREAGENPQLFRGKLTGGNSDGLRGWLSRKGMPDRDFTFEVEKSAKTWVPADKKVISLLAEEPAATAAA